MLKFMDLRKKVSLQARYQRYFPIFVATFLSLLFCIFLVRYGVYPLFFVGPIK